jgi:hypothetical protein
LPPACGGESWLSWKNYTNALWIFIMSRRCAGRVELRGRELGNCILAWEMTLAAESIEADADFAMQGFAI